MHEMSQFISYKVLLYQSILTVTAYYPLNKNNSCTIKQTSQYDTKTCPKTMFPSLVTEYEVENVINTLKGKFSAGFDEIPEFLVKCCLHCIKKPLTYTFNI